MKDYGWFWYVWYCMMVYVSVKKYLLQYFIMDGDDGDGDDDEFHDYNIELFSFFFFFLFSSPSLFLLVLLSALLLLYIVDFLYFLNFWLWVPVLCVEKGEVRNDNHWCFRWWNDAAYDEPWTHTLAVWTAGFTAFENQLTCTDGNLSFGGPLAEFKQMTILSGVCMMHDVWKAEQRMWYQISPLLDDWGVITCIPDCSAPTNIPDAADIACAEGSSADESGGVGSKGSGEEIGLRIINLGQFGTV